jgi:uncharacterized protein (DUF2164 family)
MIRKYFIYITFVAVLLIAWYYRAGIKDSVDSMGQKVKNVRAASPFIDNRIAGEIENAMGR